MPRFVLLDHDHPTPHLDLMLEVGEALWTWRLPAPPESGVGLRACRIGDHRLLYLDYEGPVSGGRGRVTRRDGGGFAWREQSDRRLVVRLSGMQLRGGLTLTRVENEIWNVLYESED